MYCRANSNLSNIYSREEKSQGNKADKSKYIVESLAINYLLRRKVFISLPRKDKIGLV